MRLGSLARPQDFDELFDRLWGGTNPAAGWTGGGYDVPTDVFDTDEGVVIRMDLPEVDPSEVEVTVQDNVLLINGRRKFPYEADKVRFLRRGAFYGDFTQRVSLGKGLDPERIDARYRNGVLELVVPHSEEIKPKKISIQVGEQQELTK
jgi:HSP20 family protein